MQLWRGRWEHNFEILGLNYFMLCIRYLLNYTIYFFSFNRSSCDSLSQAQTEFYISDNNILNVLWDGTVDGIRLKYEFFPLCANRTLGETSSGHFCSPGYPDIFSGCNTSYSINVPFGYSIELQLSVLGVTAGAFCQNSSIEVTTRNATHGDKLLLLVCLNKADSQADTFTIRTSNNQMSIRLHPKGDLHHKGFCGTYKAIPIDVIYVNNCPYGWVSGQKFCYKIFPQRLTWTKAEDTCQAKGGHLASITDNRIALLIDDIIKHRWIKYCIRLTFIYARHLTCVILHNYIIT